MSPIDWNAHVPLIPNSPHHGVPAYHTHDETFPPKQSPERFSTGAGSEQRVTGSAPAVHTEKVVAFPSTTLQFTVTIVQFAKGSETVLVRVRV